MDETVLSVFFLFPFLFRVANCGIAQSSHLSPVKPLLDGATLISSGGKFELGFFSPGRSHNRYVGIWYHDFSPSTVLWVANRESPVPNTSGSLSISGDGNLVVLDGDGAVLWSSKAASFFSNSSTAELLDTGNFILKYSGSVLWQSFDHPTDTYLPGMKIGLDLTTYVNQVFTSWRSQNDPAPGKFTLGIAPDQSTQFFIWEDGKPRWRSGRWDGQVFIGIQGMVPTYIYGFKLSNVEQEKKMYFYYTAFNSSHRYVLMPDGVERHLVWENDTADWRQFWAQPVTQCELYNMCGDNAACTDGSPPACACLKGFERRSGRCMRRAQLQCEKKGIGEKDGFFLMTGVKLPDFSVWVAEPADWSQCEAACLRNCSCEAFSYVTGIGCLVWWRDLTDIRLFATGGNDFHLRLAASEFGELASISYLSALFFFFNFPKIIPKLREQDYFILLFSLQFMQANNNAKSRAHANRAHQ